MAPKEKRVELSATETRQGKITGVIYVLVASLALAIIAGLALWLGWITLP